MKLAALHPWPGHVLEARELQGMLAKMVTPARLRHPPRWLGGAAVEVNSTGDMVLAAVVVVDADAMNIVDAATQVSRTQFPHVPGYASFREVPPLVAAFGQLTHAPDVVMINRAGQAHPRKLGTASHLGLWLKVPTVGVAAEIQMALPPQQLGAAVGSTAPVMHEEDGLVIAMAVRTAEEHPPLFVSVGHQVTLLEGATVTLASCRGMRWPEPIRLARAQLQALKKNLTRLDPEMAALVKKPKA